jgi:septin family protein
MPNHEQNQATFWLIQVYNFPDVDQEEDTKIQKPLHKHVPFAVVGSNIISEVDTK